MQIKIALPKGRLLKQTADLLQGANWRLDEYHAKAGFYHPRSEKFPNLLIKVFHEKDIPIQVAVGNYDLGICGLDWIEELLVKYPSSALVKVKGLGYGTGTLYMAANSSQEISGIEQLKHQGGVIRIASEYPNLAESFALKNRLPRFNIFPVWGAADGYPPENAELALISGRTESALYNSDITPVSRVLDFGAFLIANRVSWGANDLGEIVASICDNALADEDQTPAQAVAMESETSGRPYAGETGRDMVRLALPDGHQQLPTINLLNKAGIQVEDYPSSTGNRRPRAGLEWAVVKSIRPQDMPLQVANGNFDLAITGRDWLAEHRYQFPSSPVKELLDLRYGKVKIVAVVSQELPASGIPDLRKIIAGKPEPFRVASEYINIADKYARDNHLGHYRVIPTWGATEAFLPEDADLLIENTETGRTIARHNLKIIDTLFESTACLIGYKTGRYSSVKKERIKSLIERLQMAVEGA